MKPLSEWTDAEIRSRLRGDEYDLHDGYIAELLRRERDRCARACGEVAGFLRANGMAESVHVTEACAAAIGELK